MQGADIKEEGVEEEDEDPGARLLRIRQLGEAEEWGKGVFNKLY